MKPVDHKTKISSRRKKKRRTAEVSSSSSSSSSESDAEIETPVETEEPDVTEDPQFQAATEAEFLSAETRQNLNEIPFLITDLSQRNNHKSKKTISYDKVEADIEMENQRIQQLQSDSPTKTECSLIEMANCLVETNQFFNSEALNSIK